MRTVLTITDVGEDLFVLPTSKYHLPEVFNVDISRSNISNIFHFLPPKLPIENLDRHSLNSRDLGVRMQFEIILFVP